MPLVNYASREITCKIVYWGPARSGKTTNLQFLHAAVPADRRGELVSLRTETDGTLFFDFLPLDLGSISGFRMRFQLYTVPGQVYYNSTRQLVLRGADGVVVVADAQRSQLEQDLESMRNLHENLIEQGTDMRQMPTVLQYNKQDLADVLTAAELDHVLNYRDLPSFGASAVRGEGVVATLRGITEAVLRSLSQRLQPQRT
ncbi:MAG: GTP-binding protein [Longimicrobiales bacterium]